MARATKAQLLEALAAEGITDLDPGDKKMTVAKLEEMLEFVRDEDDDDAEPELTSQVGADTDPGADPDDDDDLGLNSLAPRTSVNADPDLDEALAESLPDDVADRIADLFGESYEADANAEDLGAGDVPEPYVEVQANYHVSTLAQGDLETIVRAQFREAVTKARQYKRRIIGYPVVAHNWPQSGDRRSIVVQVQVQPTRANRATSRRTARGDRL
jgi:hypothetical protein